jgi:hypothetical protein
LPGHERLTDEPVPKGAAGFMQERERTGVGGALDCLPTGRWFASQSAWSAAVATGPDADTELLDRSEPSGEAYEDTDTTAADDDSDAACRPLGLEAAVLNGLAHALGASGMPADAVAEHLADLAEIRGRLGGPLWQMTAGKADAYFGRRIAWHEYPALLREAQALARYFAFLSGPDGAPVRERAHAPVRCPLDALNWPVPSHVVRSADPYRWGEPSASAVAADDLPRAAA